MNHVTCSATQSSTASVIEGCARIGYLAKGFVFATVGVLALMTALGIAGGRIVGTEGAVQTLGSGSHDRIILAGIAAGLAAFVVWRIVQAIADPDRRGRDAKGLLMRAGSLVSAAAYGLLATFTLQRLQGNGGSGDDGTTEHARTLMAHDWGGWVVAAVGAAFIGVALYQMYRAYSAGFRRRWRRAEMGPDEERWAARVSRIGITARALAFLLIGGFLLEAAARSNPARAEGLRGALRAFVDQPWGGLWLGGIGVGFVCYGVYCVVNARYRRIQLDV
jgi:Domain of Unknown Function (DUF1206)